MLWRFVLVSGLAMMGLVGVVSADQETESATSGHVTVAEVLERYIEAIGGRGAITALHSRHCEGREITDLSSRQYPIFESHHLEAYAQVPSSYYTRERTDGGDFIRAGNGDRAWKKDRCGTVEDSTGGHRRLDWLLNPHNALVIQEYFPDLTVDSTLQIRGFTVYSLTSPALHRPFYFDTDTGLLIGIGPNWEIHDYREVDGVLFPHRIVMSRKGGSTTYEFDQVEHNIDIDRDLFTPSE